MRTADGFSVQEAAALVQYAHDQPTTHSDTFDVRTAFDDFLIAYPTVQREDIARAYLLIREGVQICLMVDCVQHIHIIDQICSDVNCAGTSSSNNEGAGRCRLRVCIDLDVSYRVKCVGLCIGLRRFSCYDEYDLNCMLDEILRIKFVALAGVMGYEVQLAGVMDDSPHNTSNWLVRRLKPILQSTATTAGRARCSSSGKRIHISDFALREASLLEKISPCMHRVFVSYNPYLSVFVIRRGQLSGNF